METIPVLFKKPPPFKWAEVFEREGRFFVIPVDKAEIGWGEANYENVIVVDKRDPEQLESVIRHALEISQKRVPTSDWREKGAEKPLLKAAGVRSWTAFADKARVVSVVKLDDQIKIQVFRNLGRGRFLAETKDPKFILLPDSPELGETVLHALSLATLAPPPKPRRPKRPKTTLRLVASNNDTKA